MKKALLFLRKTAIVAIGIPLLAVGCTRTLCIKTVDAETKQPLPGVATQWTEDKNDLLLGSYHYGPTNLPVSDGNGLIVLDKVKKIGVSGFIFSHPGYSNVYGIYSDRKLSLGMAIMSLDADRFILTGDLNLGSLSNGCFIVEMKPSNH